MRAAAPCICGQLPALQVLESGEHQPQCVGCGHRAAPGLTEDAAIAGWNRANQVTVVCLGCGSAPRLVHSATHGLWACRCPGCGYQSAALPGDQAAICAWCRENRPRDGHGQNLWNEKHRRQQAARQRKERC